MNIIADYVKSLELKPVFVKNLGNFKAYTFKMTVSQANDFITLFNSEKQKDEHAESRKLAFVIVDENGKKPFNINNLDDIKDLSNLPFYDYAEIMKVFNKINGFDDEDKKKQSQTEKNS